MNNSDARRLIDAVNRAVIKYRGIYAEWAKRYGISYNELLILYTIRDYGSCTQKQICDSYLLPRQTMNYAFAGMKKRGLIAVDTGKASGREKAFAFTEAGDEYAKHVLKSLDKAEKRAAEKMGEEKMLFMTESVLEYDRLLSEGIFDDSQNISENEEEND